MLLLFVSNTVAKIRARLRISDAPRFTATTSDAALYRCTLSDRAVTTATASDE